MKRVFYWPILFLIKFLAKLQLKKNKPLIIGVTGSAGKTSTMEAIATILKVKYKVKASYKANSEIGIPLNILGFKGKNYELIDWLWVIPMALIKLLINWEKYEVYVVEMGVDGPQKPKNMEYLLTIIQPKIGVFLNALPVHSEPFDHLVNLKNEQQRQEAVMELIAKEKGKMVMSLPIDGYAVLNQNDKRVRSFKDKVKAQVVMFDRVKIDIKGQILDKNSESTMAAALAVGKVMGISKSEGINSLKKNYHLPPGRMSLFKGIKKTTLLDSSYNASREPVVGALEVLKNHKGKRIAVLGDMREMGRETRIEHELVAERVVESADVLVTIGPLMKKFLVPKALKLGFDKKNVYSFLNTDKALEALRLEIIKGGETILVKGSQNTLFLEIVVEGLLKNKEDKKRLCRRGKFWDKKRQEIRE